MDILRVDVAWRSNAPADIREAAEMLRMIAEKLDAMAHVGCPTALPLRLMTSGGNAVLGNARIIRDNR